MSTSSGAMTGGPSLRTTPLLARALLLVAAAASFARAALPQRDASAHSQQKPQRVRGGFELGDHLTAFATRQLLLEGDASLADFEGVLQLIAEEAPWALRHSLVLEGLPQAQGPADSLRGQHEPEESAAAGGGPALAGAAPTLDLAYLGNSFNMSAGVTVTLKGLRLLRAHAGIPFGVFAASPGATVVMEDTVEVIEVCPPKEYARAFFLGSALVQQVEQQGTAQGAAASGSAPVVAAEQGAAPKGGAGADASTAAAAAEAVSALLEEEDLLPHDSHASHHGSHASRAVGTSSSGHRSEAPGAPVQSAAEQQHGQHAHHQHMQQDHKQHHEVKDHHPQDIAHQQHQHHQHQHHQHHEQHKGQLVEPMSVSDAGTGTSAGVEVAHEQTAGHLPGSISPGVSASDASRGTEGAGPAGAVTGGGAGAASAGATVTAPEVVVQAAKATEAEAGAHFSREVYRMGSMEVTLPVTPAGLGGYTTRWGQGATIECESSVVVPSACTSLQHMLAEAVGDEAGCTAAIRAAIKQALCSRPTCVHACQESCAAPLLTRRSRFRNKRVGRKRTSGTH